MHERERPPCDVWDLKVIPSEGYPGIIQGGYGGLGVGGMQS